MSGHGSGPKENLVSHQFSNFFLMFPRLFSSFLEILSQSRFQDMLRAALRHVNMTDTGKLSGFCSLFIGMPVKVTHKLLPPDVVQEATGEILRIGFHEEEKFGFPTKFQKPGEMPHPAHPCWKRGWVKLDLLPRWVEVRLHGSNVDYTGTKRPGVYLVEPTNADWELPYQASKVINHPNEKPVRRQGTRFKIGIRSTQVPLAPAGVGTYNNMQGKSAKDEVSVPMGHTIDLKLLDSNDNKWLHYYMILGRATSLATTLLLNFPEDDNGPDWSVFESGPPEYLTRVFAELQNRYSSTVKLVTERQVALKIFPPFSSLPSQRRCAMSGRIEYKPREWDAACQSFTKRGPDAIAQNLRQRLDRRGEEPQRKKRR